MILTGPAIIQEIQKGNISIDPFIPENVGPCSIDLRLGYEIAHYPDGTLDTRKKTPVIKTNVDDNGFCLSPGNLFLGHTIETIHSDKFAAHIMGRSSVGRLGLEVHMTAGFIDVGFKGQLTLELLASAPTIIYPGDRICQVAFFMVKGPESKYNGRYQNQTGAVASRGHVAEFGSFEQNRK